VSLRSGFQDDFETILGGEFTARVVFSPGTLEEWDTTGIYDSTHERIENSEQGGTDIVQESRVCIFYNSRPRDLESNELVRIYEDPETDSYIQKRIVGDILADSEGNAYIMLRVE
jgi:hypothetical protein